MSGAERRYSKSCLQHLQGRGNVRGLPCHAIQRHKCDKSVKKNHHPGVPKQWQDATAANGSQQAKTKAAAATVQKFEFK